MASNKKGFRVVSTFVGERQVLRWVVQRLANDDSEAKWEAAPLGPGRINMFASHVEALDVLRELCGGQPLILQED